jgi:hypothetical protein
MKPTIRAANNVTLFLFTEHTAELQSRAGAWFSERLAELREPLRTLVAQRLFLFEEGSAELRRLISVEFSLTFQRTLRVPDDGRDYPSPSGDGLNSPAGRSTRRSSRASAHDDGRVISVAVLDQTGSVQPTRQRGPAPVAAA